MNTTTQLTGALPAIILLSALLTAVISIFLLRLYKNATIKGMSKVAGITTVATGEKQSRNLESLQFDTISVGNVQDYKALKSVMDQRSAKSRRRLAWIYGSGGFVYALVMTAGLLIILDDGFLPGRFAWLLSCYSWPALLTFVIVATVNQRQVLTVVVSYFIICLLVAIVNISLSPQVKLYQLLFFWVYLNLPASLLLWVFLRKAVRAIGPLILALTLIAVSGAFVVIEIEDQSEEFLRIIVEIGASFGLGATAIFILSLLIGFTSFGFLGWKLLRNLGKRYKNKRLSDQGISVDSLWLVFAVVQSIGLVFEGPAWIILGPLAWIGYKLLTALLFKTGPLEKSKWGPVPTLLLLRVFALGSRSEKFFDRLTKWWRGFGAVSLIAGPDLITRAVEPHEFLDFLGGHLSRRFVRDLIDLKDRIAGQDLLPDPDGRYRINEFFCREDNWKMTMQQLAQSGQVVLMDLRGFTRNNQGCIYELEQLLDLVPLNRTLLLVDNATDAPFLYSIMERLSKTVLQNSPNFQVKSPTVTLFHLQEHWDSMRLLFNVIGSKVALRDTN